MRVKKNSLRFTNQSRPELKDNEVLQYMLNEDRICPGFLPMDEKDTIITPNAYIAASINEYIPISEYIRKEFYYTCA